MLLLNTTDILRITTGAGAAVDVCVHFVDRLAGVDTPDRQLTAVAASSTNTTICASPAAGMRNLRTVSISNIDATASVAVSVNLYDGANAFQQVKATLSAGCTLQRNDAEGWVIVDAAGGRILQPVTGRYIRTTLLTSASGNHTVGATTNSIFIRGVAGGAGGGGVSATTGGAAGGGGAGGYAEKTFTVTPNTAYAYVCGAAGTGSSGAAGNDGGDSTFIVGAVTVTAKRGTGGPLATGAAAVTVNIGGAGGVVGTNGDVNASGQPGANGIDVSTAGTVGASGAGGSCLFGGGGIGIKVAGNGNNGTGNGSGGSGGYTATAAARTGGSGTGGCWVVDEYT